MSIDKYLCKAIDAYPYHLEEVIESLDYAMSGDNKNAATLCLYGRVYAEQLQDYLLAKSYFQDALAADINAVFVYPYFIQLLVDYGEDAEAEKLIHFAMTVKGIDKPLIMTKFITLKEKLAQYKEAKQWLKKLKSIILNDDHKEFIEKTEARIKAKKKLCIKKRVDRKKKNKSNNSFLQIGKI
jgi:tetratricopeptide (TPR) repeat protein